MPIPTMPIDRQDLKSNKGSVYEEMSSSRLMEDNW